MLSGFLRGALYGLALIGCGWFGGSLYPAPAAWTAPVAQRMPDLAARLGLDDVSLEQLSAYMSPQQFARVRAEALTMAVSVGEAVAVERDEAALQAAIGSLEGVEIAPAIAPTSPEATGPSPFEPVLTLCPGMRVSNAPAADENRRVRDYAPRVSVNGVTLGVNPTRGACLSSAFGPRGSGQHRGVDFYSASGGPIYAAADGVVVERKYRDDYGNMLLIDHGNGVYTRYAHLSSFADAALIGARVQAGQQIGLMGNTASYAIPIHLHYEVLLGDYDNPRQSFGLEARSPFAFPSAG